MTLILHQSVPDTRRNWPITEDFAAESSKLAGNFSNLASMVIINHALAFNQTLTLWSLWLIEVWIVLKVWLRALRTLVFHSWRHTVAQSSLGPLCLPRMVWIILQYSGSLVDQVLRKREWTKIQTWPYRYLRSATRKKKYAFELVTKKTSNYISKL